jgi:hypothetical protein
VRVDLALDRSLGVGFALGCSVLGALTHALLVSVETAHDVGRASGDHVHRLGNRIVEQELAFAPHQRPP